MSKEELAVFINAVLKAIQAAVNSCPDLEHDRYVTMHIASEGDFISWNNNPDKSDDVTPKMHYFYTDDGDGERWINYYESLAL